MNTKLVMTTTAITMGLVGVTLSFAPHEVLHFLNLPHESVLSAVMFQLLGALYFGFAMINWTARSNLIGGIYGRPIAIGNLVHFVIGTLALMKGYFDGRDTIVLVLSLFYLVFGVMFVIVFYRHPVKSKN
jgi:hypothetical protein